MSEAVGKVPLLEGRREWGAFLGIVLLLFALHLGWLYREYRVFVNRPFFYTWGTVLEVKAKREADRSSRVLKIRIDGGLILWTRTFSREVQVPDRVRLQLLSPNRIGFIDYLKGPYLPSRIKGLAPPAPTIHNRLGRWIASQHRDREAAAFYRGIFLADALPATLREKISALGVSHLVALSGFHLGILWGGIFLLLRPLYRWGQRRRFPWRYDGLDLGSFSLLLLAGYLWLTGMPPSLLRSYAMLLFGWGALLLGIEVFRFAFLLVVGTVLIVLFPGLALSWGFWLSMGGVYVIFLLLKYGPVRESLWTRLLLLPVGIYWLMVPVGHTLFGTVNLWQNLSPLLSVLFIPFYPLAMLLHLLGQGALLDPVLAWLWRLPGENMVSKTLPLWFLGLYMLVALAAVRWRRAFYLLLGLAGGSLIWIYG